MASSSQHAIGQDALSRSSRSRKAAHRRKRHALPGPAGLLFQQSQSHALDNSVNKRPKDRHSYVSMGSTQDDNDDDPRELPLQNSIEFGHNTAASGISFYSPAWMVMQIDLGFRTPSLPAYLTTEEKYETLRKLFPETTYVLIPDVISGKADWNISPRSLIALVQTSRALTDNLWTVSLIDETCATIDAWIQPSFVKKEQQQTCSHQSTIQPGSVWLIQDATVMLVASKDRRKKTERMLLIKKENIQQVWSPCQADDVGAEAHKEWIDRRNTLTIQAMCCRDGKHDQGHKATARTPLQVSSVSTTNNARLTTPSTDESLNRTQHKMRSMDGDKLNCAIHKSQEFNPSDNQDLKGLNVRENATDRPQKCTARDDQRKADKLFSQVKFLPCKKVATNFERAHALAGSITGQTLVHRPVKVNVMVTASNPDGRTASEKTLSPPKAKSEKGRLWDATDLSLMNQLDESDSDISTKQCTVRSGFSWSEDFYKNSDRKAMTASLFNFVGDLDGFSDEE